MIILGLSAGHDASLAIVRSGEPIVLVEKERLTRTKHASGSMGTLIDMSLNVAGIKWNDIDHVAVVSPVWTERGYDWEILGAKNPSEVGEIIQCFVRVGKHHLPGSIISHHTAHAAYSLLSSGRRNGNVLTLDAGGGLTDASFSYWEDGKPVNVQALADLHLGSLWSVASRSLFGNIFAAGKLMGLAAFGKPVYVKDLRLAHGDPTANAFSVRSAWTTHSPILQALEGISWRSEVARNAAASIQVYTETAIITLIERLPIDSKAGLLAMGGGVALNGYLNTTVRREIDVEHTWFPPAVHDGGLALGAALLASERANEPIQAPLSPFLGLDPDQLPRQHTPAGEEFWDAIAHRIAAGEVIGLCLGRAEIGPRALGHRSIIASPEYSWMRDYLNSHVKTREPFRPIAPVILEGQAADLLEESYTVNRHMTMIGKVSRTGARMLGQFVHADGTVRAQLVRKDDTLGILILALERLGHVPAVLNTSLNRCGEPICQSRRDAMKAAGTLSLDGLVIQSGDEIQLL